MGSLTLVLSCGDLESQILSLSHLVHVTKVFHSCSLVHYCLALVTGVHSFELPNLRIQFPLKGSVCSLYSRGQRGYYSVDEKYVLSRDE